MDRVMLEKAQLRIWLRVQIRKIRQILELQRLQVLCRMRILAQRIAASFDIPFHLEGKSYNEQMNYLISIISYQVTCLVHDYELGWRGYREAVGV